MIKKTLHFVDVNMIFVLHYISVLDLSIHDKKNYIYCKQSLYYQIFSIITNINHFKCTSNVLNRRRGDIHELFTMLCILPFREYIIVTKYRLASHLRHSRNCRHQLDFLKYSFSTLLKLLHKNALLTNPVHFFQFEF